MVIQLRITRTAMLLACAIAASPVVAQTAEDEVEALGELDALAEIAVEEAAGIQFAQEQAARGEFLEAISTLERVLALHPKSQSARLLHAVYLCRIDDQLGGATEIGKLKKKDFPDDLWTQALTICTSAKGD